MRISVIGAGRVATQLIRVLRETHQIVNVYSRNFEHANQLASKMNTYACESIEQMDSQIDLLIVAISDQSIALVIEQLKTHFNEVLIVHTSGSTSISVLTEHHTRSGVFYPLQTFSMERHIDWSTTPIFVEAVQAQDLTILIHLAESLSQRVYSYNSAQRLSLHLAAVFACNFTNYCYDMAKQVVDAQKVDFSLLYPLILETAKKATQLDPQIVQTGPAMRGDQNILNMHAQMLEQANRNDLKQAYELMSQQILKRQIK